MRRLIFMTTTAVILTFSSGAVFAKPPLSEVAFVRDGLINTGIAYEISQKCDSLSARLLRGYNFLNTLKDYARSQGYTEAEIDAFTGDKTHKRALEAEARARLAGMGAQVGQPETYCTVGQREIAAQSPIGRLLR